MHISKPDIFIPVNNRLHRSGSANRPWLLAVGAGWWHVLREASSGKYKPIQRQRAQDRSACRYIPLLCKLIRPTSAYKIMLLWLVRPQSPAELKEIFHWPCPRSSPPSLPAKGWGNPDSWHWRAPFSLQPPSVARMRGCSSTQRRYKYYARGEKIAKYLQTHLRMCCIGDLKGQIRWFLTLSARSLPVFTEPNASPSVTSACPLLYPPPALFLPLSFSLPRSDGVTADLARGSQGSIFNDL